jgi:hypothetical protein
MHKESFYFSHDNNAFNDPKIRLLVHEFGMWAYGAFWVIIELISQQRGYKLARKDLELVLYAMGSSHDTLDVEAYSKMIAKCFAIGLLCADEKYIWSESFNARMQHRMNISSKRSMAGKIGSATRWGNEEDIANVKQNIIANSKGKESKGKEIKYTNTFMSVWVRYPKRIGSKRAFLHFQASVKNEDDLALINKALDNYLQYVKEEVSAERYIKNGDTWFNNWKDWVEWKSEKPQKRAL